MAPMIRKKAAKINRFRFKYSLNYYERGRSVFLPIPKGKILTDFDFFDRIGTANSEVSL